MIPLVSIIIRSFNEERWIGACLNSLRRQNYLNYEVILIDNNSTDLTVNIASTFSEVKILTIDKFLPGRAINLGVDSSDSEYLVCLSAHCIPVNEDWLTSIVEDLQVENIAGVYGRQIPVSFTSEIDKRDLFTIFGPESRIQKLDGFFHNANSAFKRNIWEICKFDDLATNIEDRIWGRNVIELGYNISYKAEAAVYHYHGVNQGNTNYQRLKGIVTLIQTKNLNGVNNYRNLPIELSESNLSIPFFLTISNEEEKVDFNIEFLISKIVTLRKNFRNPIIVLTNSFVIKKLKILDLFVIKKDLIPDSEDLDLFKLMFKVKHILAIEIFFPYAFVSLNYRFFNLNSDILKGLIEDAVINGWEFSVIAIKDYSHQWCFNSERGRYESSDFNLRLRDKRSPNYRALYGQGMFILTSVLTDDFNPMNLKTGLFEVSEGEIQIEKI
jgi:rhamnosyltransferase